MGEYGESYDPAYGESDPCDDLSGLSWGYCTALEAGGKTRDAVLAAASGVAKGAQGVAGSAIAGAQKTGQELAKGLGKVGGINLNAGSVVAIAALGVGGLLLADTYFTGGQGARSLSRSFGKGR